MSEQALPLPRTAALPVIRRRATGLLLGAFLAGNIAAIVFHPGMITATIGTGLLLGVVASSVVIVKRRLRYEWWDAVHTRVVAEGPFGVFTADARRR